jgi:hypothetical protein
MREYYRLASSDLEVEVRPGYVHVIVVGPVRATTDISEQSSVMEALMTRHLTRRALFDLRESVGVPELASNEALWQWLGSARGFDQLAYVVRADGELEATRVDMTALARGLSVRCFSNVTDAHRWLTSRSRASTQTMPAVRPNELASEPPSSGRSQSMPAIRTMPLASGRSQSMPAVRPEAESLRPETPSGGSQSRLSVRSEPPIERAEPRSSSPPPPPVRELDGTRSTGRRGG